GGRGSWAPPLPTAGAPRVPPPRPPPQSPSVVLHLRGESREPPRSDAQQRAHRVDVERLPLALQGHDTLIHDIESTKDQPRELKVLLDQQDRTPALLPDPPQPVADPVDDERLI